MPIDGLAFNYRPEGNTEYLTLFVEKLLYLTDIDPTLQRKNPGGPPMMRPVRILTIVPGSTVFLTVRR
jgi:hypothetical protein